ncbi:hypothetical protein Vretimale_14441 [Volvox reticuliferus]|uniref:Uncharacterized protein n=1 Tax=Volvox reticuliferus TaxID=1737510 RepID=A0A8J4LTZ3_9CHLO|nr:hypothetical protein Vretifemale_13220 [Volvox reticuliferus]GIM10823.1 hypothetical protein Vretimale_14441 [Volvox reticuliferus]
MEDAFLCAKDVVMLLQAKLVALRAKGESPGLSHASKQHISRTVSAYLSQLRLIHTAVREFLLQLAADPNAGTAATKLFKCLNAIAEELPGLQALEEGRPADLAAQVRQLRAAKLDDEIATMRTAIAALPPDVPVNCNTLEAVVRSLSHQEQSLDFHVKLAAEVSERFGHGAAYSIENFSYGSTPYTSWLQVLATAGPALQDAMGASGTREYVVWGSSCGWLVLYGVLTYGWRSRGVELLSCLHSCAERVVKEQEAALAGTKGVRFTCGDLLEDDISTAGLVVLADQCWDEELAAAAGDKLARELPTGALCVSYSGAGLQDKDVAKLAVAAAGDAPGDDCGDARKGEVALTCGSGAEDTRVFEEVVTVRARVSWSEAQTFRIFRKL